MPRQKTKHTLISNERVRKSTFKRRLDSLLKKAHELSILCGVEVVLIIHDPDEGHSTLWPSQDMVMNGVMKFIAIPERERLRKMVLQEKFLTDKLQEMTENFAKLQKKNEETEMGFLINQLIKGASIDALDIRQLNGLHKYIDEKLKMLQSSNDELDQVQGQVSMGDIAHHSHPSFEMTISTIAGQGQESGPFAITTGQGQESGAFATIAGQGQESGAFAAIAGQGQESGAFAAIAGQGQESGALATIAGQGQEVAFATIAGQGQESGAFASIAGQGQESGSFATTSMATLMGNMREDNWFSSIMSGIQNNQGFSQGIDIAPESTDAARSYIEGNQGEVLDDFGKVWRSIFSP